MILLKTIQIRRWLFRLSEALNPMDEKLLIVDDEEGIRFSLGEYFTRQSYQVSLFVMRCIHGDHELSTRGYRKMQRIKLSEKKSAQIFYDRTIFEGAGSPCFKPSRGLGVKNCPPVQLQRDVRQHCSHHRFSELAWTRRVELTSTKYARATPRAFAR